jgi:hypothetical protein
MAEAESEFVVNAEAFDANVAVREDLANVPDIGSAIMALRARAAATAEVTRIALAECAVAPEAFFTAYPGGRFRLTGAGASRLLKHFGADVAPPTYDADNSGQFLDDDGNEHYEWTSFVSVSLSYGGSFTAMGYWSSTRPDYMKRRAVKNSRQLLPLTREMRATIRKCSNTQALVNAVQRVLGIEGLSTPQLESAGVDVSRIKAVTFREGSDGGGGQSAETPEGDALRAAIGDLWSSVDVEALADVNALVVALSAFSKNDKAFPGKPLADLTMGRLTATKGTVERVVAKMRKDGVSGPVEAKRYAEAYMKRGA